MTRRQRQKQSVTQLLATQSQKVTETGNQKRGTTSGTAIGISGSEIPGTETPENETVDTTTTTIVSHPIEILVNETPETCEILVMPITVAERETSEIRATEILETLETYEMHATFEKGTRGICEIHGMSETCEIVGSHTPHADLMTDGLTLALTLVRLLD